ncbi:MAG: hypothetical protein JOZ73_07495 [Solirubrobacterales bacterium]|nr:hypothetical protein [Solirubrobacterales bacterium]
MFQYVAEITGEKVTAAQAPAVARGVYPHPKIPVGYVRGQDGVLVIEPVAARSWCRRSSAAIVARRWWRSKHCGKTGSSARSPGWR